VLALACMAALVTARNLHSTTFESDDLAGHRLGSDVQKIEVEDELTGQEATHPCTPTEVHLALAEDLRSMRVVWRTAGEDCGSAVSYWATASLETNRTANAGVHGKPMLQQAMGNSYSLTENIMCSAPANSARFHINMHLARMFDLMEGVEYTYTFPGSTRQFSFVAPLLAGPNPPRFSFLAYGDMGVKQHKAPQAVHTVDVMLREVEARPVELIVHVGDVAYADGSYKTWDKFMTLVEPLAARIPYMVGVGNHEYCYYGEADNDPSGVSAPYHPPWGNFADESGGECGAMLTKRMPMPNLRAGTDNAPFYYSFDYASVHFTMISTEHDISPGSQQYKWLARDLAAVDRCVTSWLVVGLHRPMYVVYPHKDNAIVGDHIRDYIESLLLEYAVDITLAGHVHTYYRTCDVREGECMEDGSGLVHYVIGTAGHKLSDKSEEQKEWLAGDANEWGFLRLDVDGDTITSSFILSSTGEAIDRATVVSRVYTEEECTDLRATAPGRTAALETRLAALTLQHQAQQGQREGEEQAGRDDKQESGEEVAAA